MKYDTIISKANLLLAWRRITTGANHPYKRYFRHLYYAYEIGLDHNLSDLHQRLKGRSYTTQSPIRIYTPKPSGLQRPLTLLSLEDQILYQAVANVFADTLRVRRRRVEHKTVFSNILHKRKLDIFFLQDWHLTYNAFQKRIKSYYDQGYRWVAYFDLAAFFDTICHELLLTLMFPRTKTSYGSQTIGTWLDNWTCDRTPHCHGLPQGPIASDFLAECFMLPIDEALGGKSKYVRYVDDIRLFGKKEDDVRKAVINLEVHCRDRGLIPQGKKFDVVQVKSLKEAMGMLPSIPLNDDTNTHDKTLDQQESIKLFRSSLGGKPQRIHDKTRARFVLYHGEPSNGLLTYVLRLLPRHPEHIDAFIHYLSNYKRNELIVKACAEYIKKSPYEYVQGELWHVLSRMMLKKEMTPYIKVCLKVLRRREKSICLVWGVCHFLCKAQQAGLGDYRRRIVAQHNSLLLALLINVLPHRCFNHKNTIATFLTKHSFEPGLMLAQHFVQHNLTPADFGIRVRQLPRQTQNVFKALGLISRRYHVVDPMGEILERRYKLPSWSGWRRLFGKEYLHGLGILQQADSAFDMGRSHWLSHQNSFNHALTMRLQKYLTKNRLPGVMRLTASDGKQIKYGILVDPNQPFGRSHPRIASAFQKANKRRNMLPGSHPYDEKGGQRTRFLLKKEQTKIVQDLHIAYTEIINSVTF